MNSENYQTLVRATAKTEDTIPTPDQMRLLNWAIGLVGETGELLDHLKKHVWHGHELDLNYVINELGDIGWYRAQMASELELTLDLIDTANINKLRERYPDGFTQQASINRVDTKTT